MVHEVPRWDSDSDWVDDEEQDELDQDSLMLIEGRVSPAELREMTVANVCRTFTSFRVYRCSEKLTLDRAHTRWSNRLESGVPKR
jgi:hypothetical protein